MTLTEKLKQHPYVSENVVVNLYQEPFKYLVIDNLFKPEIYAKLSNQFPEYISRKNSSHGQVGDNPNNIYNAIIYGFKSNDYVNGFEFFIDTFWKDYLSEILNIEFNQHVTCSAHFHKGSPEQPSKSGWVHKDLSICSAIEDPSKSIKNIDDCEYADDSNGQIFTKKIIRSVANLFYLNNIENPQIEDGGGTAVCNSYNIHDRAETILPINNRLFAFEISPISYHAFIGAKFDRSAIVQWFHSDPIYIVKKHLQKFKKQWKDSHSIFERWKKNDLWNIEQHPDYWNNFDKPFEEVLNS
jgi:hypothetical protein